MSDLGKRFATFFATSGALSLMAFVYFAKEGVYNFWLPLVGLPLTILSFRALFKNRAAPQKAERFRGMRKVFTKKKKGGDDGGGGDAPPPAE